MNPCNDSLPITGTHTWPASFKPAEFRVSVPLVTVKPPRFRLGICAWESAAGKGVLIVDERACHCHHANQRQVGLPREARSDGLRIDERDPADNNRTGLRKLTLIVNSVEELSPWPSLACTVIE